MRRSSKTAPASTNAPSTASTRATGCSTSTPTNASTAVPASRSARSRRSTTKTTCPSKWADYYKANVEFFDEVGSPGRRREGRRDPRRPPGHRRAAAPGALTQWRSSAARLPVGRARAVRGSAPRRTRRHRRPVGRFARRPDARRRPRRRSRAATDAHAYPQTAGHARPCARRSSSGTRAAAASRSSTSRNVLPDHRLEGARRPAADPARPRRPATSSCSRAPPTRPTRSAPRVVGAPCSRPTSPTSGRPRRGSSGSTARATPTAGCTASRVPAPRRRARARARRRHRERRVLRRARLGRRMGRPTPVHPRPAGDRGRRAASRWRSTRSASSRTWPATAPAFVAGCSDLIGELLAVRKHLGPHAAGPRAGGDDRRARRRRARRRAEASATARGATCSRRRSRPPASASTRSEAGLYLWATAGRGRVGDRRARSPTSASSVGPGHFYGEHGPRARADRAHRHRRADRRRRRAPRASARSERHCGDRQRKARCLGGCNSVPEHV